MKKKNRKRAIILTCIAALIILAVIQSNTNFLNQNLPFLPIENHKVLNISVFDGTSTHNLSEKQKEDIIAWLNSIKRYEHTGLILHNSGGRPDHEKEIIILFSDITTVYLNASSNGCVSVGEQFSMIGMRYYVNQAELCNFIEKL